MDTGADRTVFDARLLGQLQFDTWKPVGQLSGVGGTVSTVAVDTKLRFTRADGALAVFQGEYAAFTQPESLDMSVLGRDILDHFALIADRKTEVVCLLGPPHRYVVQ